MAQRGKNGTKTVTALNTIVNEYTYLTANAAAGSTSITVAASSLNANNRFASALTTGDLVMIIQMQGASLKGGVNDNTWGTITAYNNCGLYEFKEVLSVPNGTTITFSCPIINNYTQTGNVQVVRVPRFNALNVNNGGSLIAPAWNGQTGGVLVVEALANISVNNGGSIDVSGKGFRGGIVDNSSALKNNYIFSSLDPIEGGEKGEGVGGFQAAYDALGGRYGRAAAGNGGGGGNAHNSGGGGGANAGNIAGWNGNGNPDVSVASWANAWNLEAAGFSTNTSSGGGRGGYSFSYKNVDALTIGPDLAAWGGDLRRNNGGKGGRPVDYSTGRIFMGGGGGSGDANDGSGTNGAPGGGIVYLLGYGTLSGKGNIIANGSNGTSTPGGGTDGPSGGGGGGTIMLNILGGCTGIAASANGGRGGDQIIGNIEAEGPGGGGGGGYIALTSGVITSSANGGNNGTTTSTALTEFLPNGATKGGNGFVDQIIIPVLTLTANDQTICSGSTATLLANVTGTGAPTNPTYYWYTTATSTTPIYTGNPFVTPVLTANTTYYVRICEVNYRIPVNVIINPTMTVGLTKTDAKCKGGSTGTITTSISGGTSPYSYNWSTSPVQNTSSAINLKAGTYSVTVTDAVGCTATSSISITEPNFLIASITNFKHATCSGGSISISASGGTSPYVYASSPNIGSSTNYTNVAPGTYVFTVTDANNCKALVNQTISQVSALNANLISTTPVSCSGGNNGTAVISAFGGTAPYNYSWSPGGGNASSASNLSKGNYVVTVRDNESCQTIVNVSITEPTALNVSLSNSNVSCFGKNNASINALVSGGSPGYTYTWSKAGETGASINNLSTGNYSVVVNDSKGCSALSSVTITQPSALAGNMNISHVSCNGNKNGSATLSVSGGTSPYIYSWDNGAKQSTNSSLDAGTYNVIVTDNNGCSLQTAATITQPVGMTVLTSSTPATCGIANGVASTTVSGGIAPYTYFWQSIGSTTPAVTNISAGVLTVTITDANNCSRIANVVVDNINPPIVSFINKTPISCKSGNDGTASINISGSTGPYTYLWSPSGETTSMANNLPAGKVHVTVTDNFGCKVSASDSLVELPHLTVLSGSNKALCYGASNGTAYVSVSGGTAPYTYSWNSGSNTSAVTGLSNGTYTVTITDAKACTFIETVSVDQPLPLSVILTNISNAKCKGANDGQITASVSGGTTPYAYSWKASGGSAPIATGLSAGSYSLTVSDANNCSAVITASIGEPTAISLVTSKTNALCNGASNGTGSVTTTGGTAPYKYLWSTGATTSSINSLLKGSYQIKVTDINSCEMNTQITINEPTVLAANPTITNAVCLQPNGKAVIVASGGTPAYNYSWSNGNSNGSVASNLANGTYSVTVTDANNCSLLQVLTINNTPMAANSISSSKHVTCFGGNDGNATVISSGGQSPYFYTWFPYGGNTNVASDLKAGTYTVIVTDGNNCTIATQLQITQPIAIQPIITSVTDLSCTQSNDGTATASASGGNGSYSYTWSTIPVQSTATATNLGPNKYTVTVKDITGCTAAIDTIIKDPGNIIIQSTILTNVTCFGNNNGSISTTASGGIPPYSISWNTTPVQNTAIVNNLKAGKYIVTFTDKNGCKAIDSVDIFEPSQVITVAGKDTLVCPGATAKVSVTATGGSGLYTFNWNNGLDSSATHQVNPTADTTMYVVSAKDKNGCTGNADTMYVFHKLFKASDINAYGGKLICKGDSVQVGVSSTLVPAPTYQWLNVPGGNKALVFVKPTVKTTYTVVATDNCGSTVQDTVTVSVNLFPVVNFTTKDTAVCIDVPVHFTDLSAGGKDSIIAWFWDFGDGNVSTAKNPVHTYNSSGSYTISLTVTSSFGCKNTLVKDGYITVFVTPFADFILSPFELNETNGTVNTVNTSKNAVTYLWKFNDPLDTASSTSFNTSHNYTKPGDYCVDLLVKSKEGCKNAVTHCVTVKPDWTFYIPNAFTPNNDKLNEGFIGVGTNIHDMTMLIFDRWGNLIFDYSQYNEAWNGRVNNGTNNEQIVQEDVYVWKVTFIDIFGKKHLMTGHVTVVK